MWFRFGVFVALLVLATFGDWGRGPNLAFEKIGLRIEMIPVPVQGWSNLALSMWVSRHAYVPNVVGFLAYLAGGWVIAYAFAAWRPRRG